jgi:hypothetical protein
MASSSTSGDGNKIIEFPQPEITPEERARRLRVEVERLARLTPGEWLLWADEVCQKHTVSRADLKAMVEAVIKANEKKKREDKAEDRRRERHVERRAEKDEAQARREADRSRKEQLRADKEAAREAERREKEKDSAFAVIMGLPSAEHEARLAELAEHLDADLELLRDEFAVYVAAEDDIRRSRDAKPWEETVSTQALMTEVMDQIRRYMVVHDDVAIAVTLWTMFAWIHDIAVHSPNLDVDSAEPDSGKSTLLGVLSFLVPRPYKVAEITGSNIYRIVDRTHPTLIIDEADQLLCRKPALTEIINASWTRGTKIPRMVNGIERLFDPFCPKIICGRGLVMADTTASRGIRIKLWPKSADESVEDFDFVDDDTFVVLRRKLARWSIDNSASLKEAHPAMPAGFLNRLRLNWKLLFAIADLGGDAFARSARTAAVRLSRKRHQPSEGLRLFAALSPLVANREEIPSAEIVGQLNADKDGEWCEFRGRGPITQRQIAKLLEPYDIFPGVTHPTKRSTSSPRGYKTAPIRAVIARLLPNDPHIRTSKPGGAQKPDGR